MKTGMYSVYYNIAIIILVLYNGRIIVYVSNRTIMTINQISIQSITITNYNS